MILQEIVRHKKEELKERKSARPLKDLKARLKNSSDPRGFHKTLSRADGIVLIAEIKKASPVKGVLREDFDPVKIAHAYHESGASALSVLTDEHFFQGRLDYLSEIRKAIPLPILQKDFLVDDYQIYEARAFEADAVLLIASLLDPSQLKDYYDLAHELGMDAVVEVHTEKEMEKALTVGPNIIGINNRDLDTFKADLATTSRLIKYLPPGVIVVSESGIESRRDVLRLQEAGVHAVLVGESLMKSRDISAKVRELLGRG